MYRTVPGRCPWALAAQAPKIGGTCTLYRDYSVLNIRGMEDQYYNKLSPDNLHYCIEVEERRRKREGVGEGERENWRGRKGNGG